MKGINIVSIMRTWEDEVDPEIEVNFEGDHFNNTCSVVELGRTRYNIDKFVDKLDITPAEIKYIRNLAEELKFDKVNNCIDIDLRTKSISKYFAEIN